MHTADIFGQNLLLSEQFFYEHLVKGFLLSNQLPEDIPDRVFLPFLPKTYVAYHLD
jgi:hypothetical protein